MKETLVAHLIGSLLMFVFVCFPLLLYALAVIVSMDSKVDASIRAVLSEYQVTIEQ